MMDEEEAGREEAFLKQASIKREGTNGMGVMPSVSSVLLAFFFVNESKIRK